jgi:hypothetical protein
MRVVVCWATRIHVPVRPTRIRISTFRRHQIRQPRMKGDGIASNCWRISYSITPSAHPDLSCPCGRWRAEQQEYVPVRPTCCIQSQLSAATKSDGSYHQNRRFSVMVNHASPRQRITFSLIRALLKLSTEATVQRFIRFKVNGSFWCRIPLMIPLIYKEIDVAQKSSLICVTCRSWMFFSVTTKVVWPKFERQ